MVALSSATFYRVAHRMLWVRGQPSTTADKVGSLVFGTVVSVENVVSGKKDGASWAELSQEECNFLGSAGKPCRTAFVLIDGTALGLPSLLQALTTRDPEYPPPTLWRMPHALLAAARVNAVGPALMLHRPRCYPGEEWPHAQSADDYLCYWLAHETRCSAGAVGWHGPVASDELHSILRENYSAGSLRLATATLVRGAPASTVAAFAAYYRVAGFHSTYLYFDAPHEDAAAIAAARSIEGCANRSEEPAPLELGALIRQTDSGSVPLRAARSNPIMAERSSSSARTPSGRRSAGRTSSSREGAPAATATSTTLTQAMCRRASAPPFSMRWPRLELGELSGCCTSTSTMRFISPVPGPGS